MSRRLFSHSVVSNSLQPHGLQHTRLPCSSPSRRACSNSMSVKSVMPSNCLILCHLLLLPPSIFSSIRVFLNDVYFFYLFRICLSSVQSLSHVQLFETPGTAACQASLSITNCWSLLKFMSIKLVMLSKHLILCRPLLLLLSIFPSTRILSSVNSSHQVTKVLEFQHQHQSFQ